MLKMTGSTNKQASSKNNGNMSASGKNNISRLASGRNIGNVEIDGFGSDNVKHAKKLEKSKGEKLAKF